MKLYFKQWHSYLALIIAPLFWSGNFVIGRTIHQQMSPIEFSFYRWLVVVLILFPFVRKSVCENKSFLLSHWKRLLLLSLLSISTYTSFIYLGLQQTTVINASLLNSCIPVLIILLSMIVLNERLTLLKLISSIISVLGVFILIMHGNMNLFLELHFNVGDSYVVVAVIAWALFSVFYKKIPNVLPPLTFLFVTAVIGEFILLIPYIIEIICSPLMQVNKATLASIFYAAIFSSIVAFSCWSVGVQNLGPSKASYFFNLLPVFSFILAICFLEEHIHMYQFFGSFFIFLGVFIAVKSNSNLKNVSFQD